MYTRFGGIVVQAGKRKMFVVSDMNWLPAIITEYKGQRHISEDDDILEEFGEEPTTELQIMPGY
jgi:hypothetical protein